jgi:coenzyme Q-binding protein COQ10
MKVHTETKILPFKPDEIFELVGDVAKYPEFLPWCTGARIRERQKTATGETMVADLMIGFKMGAREIHQPRHFGPAGPAHRRRIYLGAIQAPQEPLELLGDAERPVPNRLHLEFEFSSVLLQKLIGVLFHEAVRRMVAAFEARAHQLYTPIS